MKKTKLIKNVKEVINAMVVGTSLNLPLLES